MDLSPLLVPLGFFAVNILTPGPNVLNTIGVALGSGRQAAFGSAAACGVGVLIWAAAAMLGAGALFTAVPEARTGMTLLGAFVLIYFAQRYIRRALSPTSKVAAVHDTSPAQAFRQALAILASNPKALTTWVALLSIFPVISQNWRMMVAFGGGCALAAVLGHIFYATVFSTRQAARIYSYAARPVNAAVGVGFFIYALKLLAEIVYAEPLVFG